jgi:hypothetical protein
LAALLAAHLVLFLKAHSFILEGDSLIVILALQRSDIMQDRYIATTISQVLATIPLTTSWTANHVNQSANFSTHHMANWAATRNFSGCIPIFSIFSRSSSYFGLDCSFPFLVP